MAPRAQSIAAGTAGIDRRDRRKHVEAALRAVAARTASSPGSGHGWRSRLRRSVRGSTLRRVPPPEGQLGSDEASGSRIRDALIGLGPVFAGFGRYLATRFDLLPRRIRTELGVIPDEGESLARAAIAALVEAQLGAPLDRLFFEFHDEPFEGTLWIQRHAAWLAPGVPVTVTLVRPDAFARIDIDTPLLPLIGDHLELPVVSERALLAAVDDYAATLRRRLDQKAQVSAFASIAAEARRGGGFHAPKCYHDYCATHVLTTERVVGEPIDSGHDAGAREQAARRVASAWLRQAFSGSVVPYDFGVHDLVLTADRLLLTGAAFEPHAAAERPRFAAYVSAVAADNPDAAASWILDGPAAAASDETRLRRMLRQAVPFRDGEWSGDERLAEHVLVQWRVATEAGWEVVPHHQHLYRGLHALANVTEHLAPDVDTLLAALDEQRMRIGLAQAGSFASPANLEATLDRAIQELVVLPQRIDEVLTRAAEGRLRTKLQIPESDETEHTRNRTVLLVTSLVAFGAVATVLRHLQPALGGGIERMGALLLLVLGGWLLIAAARL